MSILRPDTAAELAEIIQSADGPFAVQGGRTRHQPGSGTPLSTAGLSGIDLYEPGALTIVAGAGTPVAEIEAALAAEGQMLPFEPMDHRALLGTSGTPTIGGAVAMNVSGPRRIYAGACRDSLIGVKFVDGSGDLIKSGGRVMKNVTGYDLVKLLAGSRGTLGVLTEVSFKVLPRPDSSATICFDGLSVEQAIAVMSTGLTSPYQVTGAAHLPGDAPQTILRLEGFEASVVERADALVRGLAPFGTGRIERDMDQVWADLRDARAFAGSDGDVWRISVRPSVAPKVAESLAAADLLFDWGGGLIWARTAKGFDVRDALAGIVGHATLVRADKATFDALGSVPAGVAPLATLASGLRKEFDPRGLLNAGYMG